jgi:hypothetical protein
MKKAILALTFSLACVGISCVPNDPVEPEIIIDPIFPVLVSRDSITTGKYLGVEIGAEAETVYATLQKPDQAVNLRYVSIVGNIFSSVSQLQGRLNLYQSLYLDELKGTDSGVQITFEAGSVKNIYLNSGQGLSQWPQKEGVSASVRTGDKVESLYPKLLNISNNKSYSNKFERISLFVKELSTQYDPVMANSRQWYIYYTTAPGVYEDFKINFENGKVKYLDVSRYKYPVQ